MTVDDADLVITPLVRQYSLKAEEENPDDPLASAMGTVVREREASEREGQHQRHDWQRWLLFAEPPAEIALEPLAAQCREVAKVWKGFQAFFPEAKEGEVSTVGASNVPTLDHLLRAVQRAEADWEQKKKTGLGKAKGRFRDFLETMDDHSYLFSVIPDGDKYTSLITGIVTSVVKATVNHKKIAEGFSLALIEISQDLRFVQRSTRVSDSAEIRRLVVELYVKVFKFLCHAMLWYQKPTNRLKGALNKNFYDDLVRRMVSDIQLVVKRIKDEAAVIAQGRVGEMADYLFGLQVVGNANQTNDITDIKKKLEMVLEILGASSLKHLGAVEEHTIHDRRISARKSPLRISQKDNMEPDEAQYDSDTSSDDPNPKLSRYEVIKLCESLNMHIEDGRDGLSQRYTGISRPLLPDEVMIEIQNWIKTVDSRMIWIEGPDSTSFGSGLSLAAHRIYSISMQAELPCISVFCKPYHSTRTKKTDREAALISLLYSVISQLARLLPIEFEMTDGIDETKFKALNGTLESAEIALGLVKALLTHAPRSLIWVVDGLQFAEGQTTAPYLARLLEILREDERNRVSKVCFTTHGNSLTLLRAIRLPERVDASRMAQSRPGHIFRGGSDPDLLRGP